MPFQPRFNAARSALLRPTILGALLVAVPAHAQPTPEPPASGQAAHAIESLPPAPAADAVAIPQQSAEAVPHDAPAPIPPATWPEKLASPALASASASISNEPLRAIVARMNRSLPLKQGRLVVLKKQRVLQLFDGDALVKSYRVSLGPRPVGAKASQGDGRTPEGEFFVCTRNARTSAFHIFLGLSYPALPDATRGVKQRKITPREFQAIRSRLASRQAPPWRTRLGGWVGIHGEGKGAYAARVRSQRGSPDWTAGCVAVTNAEVEEISAALPMGARVSIRP